MGEYRRHRAPGRPVPAAAGTGPTRRRRRASYRAGRGRRRRRQSSLVGGRRLGGVVVLRDRAAAGGGAAGLDGRLREHRPRPERRAEDRGAADPAEVPGVRGPGRPRHRRRHPRVDLRADPGLGRCAGLDYADDIEPWLGDRFAVAAVDTGGDVPDPVVRGPGRRRGRGRRRAGRSCATAAAAASESPGRSPTAGRWSGETQEIVDEVAADAADAPLSDDDDFQHWTDAAGDAGIASMYVAPEAGKLLADELDELGGLGGLSGLATGCVLDGTRCRRPASASRLARRRLDADELTERAQGLQGRGRDGPLRRRRRSSSRSPATRRDRQAVTGGRPRRRHGRQPARGHRGRDRGRASPTAGSADLVDQLADAEGSSADELMDEASEETGLDLPDDVETLVGDSLALAVGADFDPDGARPSSDRAARRQLRAGRQDQRRRRRASRRCSTSSARDGRRRRRRPRQRQRRRPRRHRARRRLPRRPARGRRPRRLRGVPRGGRARRRRGRDRLRRLRRRRRLARRAGRRRRRGRATNLEPLDALGISAWLDDDTAHAGPARSRPTERSIGATSRRSPAHQVGRRDLEVEAAPAAETKTVSMPSADSSSTVGCGRF